MSSPFSTFTDKEKEKTSRSKLEGKGKNKNIEGFAFWSGISLAFIIGYIGFGANLKALSLIKPENWLSTDKDFAQHFKTEGTLKGGDEPVDSDETDETPSPTRPSNFKSLAKSIAYYSNFRSATTSESCFGRPTSDNSTHFLDGKYYSNPDDNTSVNAGAVEWMIKFFFLFFFGIGGNANSLCGSLGGDKPDIINDPINVPTSKQVYAAGNSWEAFGRVLEQMWNQTLTVRQYVRSNNLLRSTIADYEEAGKSSIKSEEGQGGGGAVEFLSTVHGFFKTFNENVGSHFTKDVNILLWPLLLVLFIVFSIIQPIIMIGEAMYDSFLSNTPTGGASFKETLFPGGEDGPTTSQFYNNGWWPFSFYTSDKTTTTVTNVLGWAVAIWNYFLLTLTFIFCLIISIVYTVKNFLFSVIDIIEKTLFFILPFSWTFYTLKDNKTLKDGFSEMAKFFTKNLKVGILAWLFILVILAFSYLGTEFAVGGIIGLLSILAYLIGTQTGIIEYLQKLLGTNEQNVAADGKSVFDNIIELFSQKPFFTTFVITFIAGITTTLVLLTNHLAF